MNSMLIPDGLISGKNLFARLRREEAFKNANRSDFLENKKAVKLADFKENTSQYELIKMMCKQAGIEVNDESSIDDILLRLKSFNNIIDVIASGRR